MKKKIKFTKNEMKYFLGGVILSMGFFVPSFLLISTITNKTITLYILASLMSLIFIRHHNI